MALERIGCHMISLTLPFSNQLSFQEQLKHQSGSLALSRADLVIDLTRRIKDSDMDQHPLSKTRVLSIDSPIVNEPHHLMTSDGVTKRVNKIVGLIDDGGNLHVSSPSGTQISFDLTHCSRIIKTGIPSKIGAVAKWPTGSIELFPDQNDLNADIIVMPGDLVLDAKHIIKNPVRLEIEKGNIVEIKGESSDANLIKAQLEYYPNPEKAYSFRSVCLGLRLSSTSSYSGPFDPERLEGSEGGFQAGWVTVSTGTRNQSAISLTLTNASVALGNVEIFSNGQLSANLRPDIYEISALEL